MFAHSSTVRPYLDAHGGGRFTAESVRYAQRNLMLSEAEHRNRALVPNGDLSIEARTPQQVLELGDPPVRREGAATKNDRFSFKVVFYYPSPDLSPRLTDPRNLHLPFRKEILAIVGALVMDAAPASDPNGRNIKFRREGLTLWLRVLALLSQREAESIETASELWPPALRRRLNSALDQHEPGSSRSSPFRSTFFRPGLKYINRFEFRDFSAARRLASPWVLRVQRPHVARSPGVTSPGS